MPIKMKSTLGPGWEHRIGSDSKINDYLKQGLPWGPGRWTVIGQLNPFPGSLPGKMNKEYFNV
jgi:hypothetical protein